MPYKLSPDTGRFQTVIAKSVTDPVEAKRKFTMSAASGKFAVQSRLLATKRTIKKKRGKSGK